MCFDLTETQLLLRGGGTRLLPMRGDAFFNLGDHFAADRFGIFKQVPDLARPGRAGGLLEARDKPEAVTGAGVGVVGAGLAVEGLLEFSSEFGARGHGQFV